MGKNKHSQDKLWITYKELVEDWGGKSDNNVGRNRESQVKRLPFYCCSLSFMPFKDPVCLQDGTIFDIVSILPYIRKFKKNPITGQPIKPTDLIKLNFYKNPEGEYHCPMTYKVFTENSTIIAIKETGNVYSYEAYDELNKKPKNFKDLLTDVPFDPKNIIVIQDPQILNQRNINEFDFVKKKEDVEFIKNEIDANKKENFVNIPSTYLNLIEHYEENSTEEQLRRSEVLKMINNRQNIEEADERTKKIKQEYEEFNENIVKLGNELDKSESINNLRKIFRVSPGCFIYYTKKKNVNNEDPGLQVSTHDRFSEGKTSSSFTSTSLDPHYKNKMRTLTDDEIRYKTYYQIVKSKQSKGYVRMNTNFGYLNLQIECDLVPKTSENFLELCEAGYYNNTNFHRLVKGFVLQGGDPTGTGRGGTSSFGKSFEDEFHPKLTHSKRGILSMANSGKHTNSSQFFITFQPTPHLDNRHSVFGEVVGNIKVLDEIENIGSEKKDGKPKKEIRILSMEVFSNPYRDAIVDMITKDLILKLSTDSKVKNSIKETQIDEKLKKYDHISDKINNINDSKDVGKYLKRKRATDYNFESVLYTDTDPYLYEKPNKEKYKGQFNFAEW